MVNIASIMMVVRLNHDGDEGTHGVHWDDRDSVNGIDHESSECGS